MPLPPEQIGAVPQSQAMNQQGDQELEILRQDPEVKQAIEMFAGRPVDMAQLPPDIIKGVAGMVHKLGVQGAVQMAQKMIPQDIQQKLRQGTTQQDPQVAPVAG